jgi:hypothetical protein
MPPTPFASPPDFAYESALSMLWPAFPARITDVMPLGGGGDLVEESASNTRDEICIEIGPKFLIRSRLIGSYCSSPCVALIKSYRCNTACAYRSGL